MKTQPRPSNLSFGATCVLGVLGAFGCAASAPDGRDADAGVDAAPPHEDARTPDVAAALETRPQDAPLPDARLDASTPDAAPDAGGDTSADHAADAVRIDGPSDVDGPPVAGCAGEAFAWCEDFESGPPAGKRWKATQNKGTATFDTTRAAGGSKTSLHVHVDPGSDTTVGIVETQTFPTLANKLFARAFLYIPSAMATSLFTGDRHSRLIYAQGANPYGEYALGIWSGGLIQNHFSKTDDSVDTKILPPFDEWFCLEYELDAASGAVRAYLNDVELPALRHDGWPATKVASLLFGVDRFGAFPVAEDLWFDDLVVDAARIGCAR